MEMNFHKEENTILEQKEGRDNKPSMLKADLKGSLAVLVVNQVNLRCLQQISWLDGANRLTLM